LIIIEQEEKLSKIILIVVFLKLILNNYPGATILLILSFSLVLNMLINITNRTEDFTILIIPIKPSILPPSMIF
jgi:hypothetical protein